MHVATAGTGVCHHRAVPARQLPLTGLVNGVESSTRRLPTTPAWRAATRVTSKIRSGRADRASRARISTSTVCTNPG